MKEQDQDMKPLIDDHRGFGQASMTADFIDRKFINVKAKLPELFQH